MPKPKIKNSVSKPKYQFLIDKAKSISLPGCDGVPILHVIKFFLSGLKNGFFAVRASAIAFNLALAIFPTMIFLFALIPFIPVENLQTELLKLIRDFLPHNALQYFESTLVSVVMVKKIGVFSFGAFASLIFSTSAVHVLIQSFSNTYHNIDTRKWINTRIVSTFLVFTIFILIATSVLLITFGQFFLKKLVELEILQMNLTYYLIYTGKWIVIIALFFFSISFLYYFAPAKKAQWKFISPGSTIATILALLSSLGFSYFVNNFGLYNKLYGSIGTIMVILLWLYLNSIALILGFELNASIHNAQLENTNE